MAYAASPEDVSLCPSAQPDWEDSVAIGVVEGTAEKPRMVHFSGAIAISRELLQLTEPVTPSEVFRFAAPCMQGHCVHFQNSSCGLVTQIVQVLPAVAESLPTCVIRPKCRWWRQAGKAACMRCDQVVTDNYNSSPEMRIAATPPAIEPRRCRSI
jgi:hypothetical protein